MTTSLLLLALAGFVLPGQGGDVESLLESGLVQTLEVRLPPGTRVEHFRLDREERDEPPGQPLGLVRLIVGPDAEARTVGRTGLRLESETRFFGQPATRVLHAERLRFEEADAPPAQTLVWREVRPRSGRTVLFERDPGGLCRSSETVGGEILRQVHSEEEDVLLPLAMLEAARVGELPGGRYGVFQPLSSSLEVLSVGTYVDPSSGTEERVLELFRPEGDLAGRYVFQGERLMGFQLQAGGLRAHRVSRADYERLLAEHVKESPGEADEPADALRPGPRGG